MFSGLYGHGHPFRLFVTFFTINTLFGQPALQGAARDGAGVVLKMVIPAIDGRFQYQVIVAPIVSFPPYR
ncbi:hypothetical protein RIE95_09590 [Acidithiobacillus thiooxidans]|uniref:hypothetical protein n=1 Tax=Acidithiobacillus thiooxidans TaxID=930 RepID=UPI00285F40CD|nr:hypothetical protein [Acidithiobacillus thiooxidans]MDR7927230.1 hypothetical protein [Acidithiobacillus thiooxidans]